MIVQAEASLYPLRMQNPGAVIEMFIGDLKDSSLEVKTGPMSSRVTGELAEVFSVLSNAFEGAAANSQVVLTLKISNACPIDAPD
ncbi:MAG: thiamine-binding protein [Planctomycetes bacterium]|nr:thiamine-binding protein [Planctomycetota bacterium]